jgi:xanthine dehydrogenase molybdenum-binding subunit
MPDCVRLGAEAIGWQAKWKGWDTPVAVNGAKKRGIGFNTGVHVAGGGYFLGHAGAIVKMRTDGTVQLMTGACQAGNSIKTTQAQVCAEALGVRFEDIAVTFSDTDPCPYTIGSYASRIAHSHSIAVKAAAEQVKAQLFEVAAPMLGVTPEELEAKDRQIYVKAAPANAVALTDVIAGVWAPDVMGSAATRSFMLDGANFMAQFVEVEVDTETGEVEVLKVVAAHDIGTAINPTVCENQIYGGLMQGGIGYGTTEELLTDPATGAQLNPYYLDYKVKTAMDTPDIEPILVQPPDYTLPAVLEPLSAYGIKGMGEGVLVPTGGAILNAVRNATGIDFRDHPVTPDRILKALGKA